MKPTITPTIKQNRAWQILKDSITIFLIFGGGAGGGKSWLGCEWLITNCYFYPGSKWFIGRKELSRLMKSSYVTFLKVCAKHKIPRGDWSLNGKYNYIEFFNGSRIDLLDVALKPSDPFFERFGSLEYSGGWLEEAGEIPFGAFDVLKTRIGRHLNKELNIPPKILITCNPSKNWLYRLVYKLWKKKTLPEEYQFVQSLYGDNPHTAEDYGRMLTQIANKATKQRLKYGNWEYDDDPDKLMEYDAITDMFTNTVPESNDRFLTGDIARYGRDKIVLYCWRGFEVYKMYVYEKQGIDKTITKVRDILKDERIPYSHCIVDDDGVGGGVVDGLRGIKGFVNNSSALPNPETEEKENYRNLKAQCSYMFAKKVNNRGVSISAEMSEKEKEMIIEECDQVRGKDVERDAPLQLVPKEEVKDLIGRSPDFSDALIQRMYFDLHLEVEEEVEASYVPTYRKR